MTFVYLPIAVIIAFLLALYMSPVAARAARKFGIIDKPDGELKVQKDGVPYFGGLAIFTSFLLAYSFVYGTENRTLAILLSGSIIVIVGLIDDFQVLSPGAKFTGQLVAAYILVDSGIYIKLDFLSPWIAIPLTVVWLVGMMNALNIIDIMDGLAVGVSSVAGMFFLIVAIINNDGIIIALTAVMIGSTLGFLKFNFQPARIYMGDSGSMFLGLLLGALSIIGDYSTRNKLGFISPLIILSIPLFDTFLVMFLRIIKGKSPFFGSKDHFAVRLRIKGFSVPFIVISTYGVGLIMGGLAVLNLYLTFRYSLILIVATGLFYIVSALLLVRISIED